MSLHLGCRLMRQSSYSPRCKKLVALGSEQPFAAIRVNVCLLLNQLYHRNDVSSNGSGSSATDLKFW